MLGRLKILFRRYCAEHLSMAEYSGPSLKDAQGLEVVAIQAVSAARGTLDIRGRSQHGTISLTTDRGVRKTVSASQDGSTFELDWKIPVRPFKGATIVWSKDDRENVSAQLDLTGLQDAYRRLLLRFLSDLLRCSPAILRWRLTKDPRWRIKIKHQLGFSSSTTVLPFRDQVLRNALPSSERGPRSGIIIVMPVYNAGVVTLAALHRVAANTDLDWQIIVIDDASTEPGLRDRLKDWCDTRAEGQAHLITHETNRGFVTSANAGLARAIRSGRHVVLLNSDALVPPGWASRLVAPLDRAERVATVTPMSNDAEILTAPAICAAGPVAQAHIDQIDETIADIAAEPVELPTGVGFCMAMHRDAIAECGQFDSAFGRGYGEEVDWGQRLIAKGWHHVGLPSLFVAHIGGSSFGTAEKHTRIAENNVIISKRYPEYDADVADFLAEDPLLSERILLGLSMINARATKPVHVYIAHDMAGGAEVWLQQQISDLLQSGQDAVILRIGGLYTWQIELHCMTGISKAGSDNFSTIRALVKRLETRKIIYSCGVGANDAFS